MTIVYILAAVLIFGLLVAVHELGHFLAAKLCGVQVNEFSIGMGPVLWKRKKSETQYSLRALPVGGFCAMEGEDDDSDDERALSHQGFWKQFFVFAAGSGMNFLAGFLIVLALYSGADAFYTTDVMGFAPDFAAQGEQGLQPGDQLWTINGERVYQFTDVQLLTGLDADGLVDLSVKRDGAVVSLGQIALPYQTYTNTDGKPYQGYGLTIRVEEATVGSTLKTAWLNTVDFVRVVRLSLQMLFQGEAGVEDLSGPVGIVNTMTQEGEKAQKEGGFRAAMESLFSFAAMLAVNLSIMNLLPIPALDGGHILFLAVDTVSMALFHRKMPAKYAAAVNTVGFVVLMGFMLLITFKDVFQIFR